MHSNTRQALNASTRSVNAKWYWVNHGRLTSERQAHQRMQSLPSATHRHSLITRPCCSSAKRQGFCLVRVDAFATRRRGNHMHDHSRFQRDIDWRHRRLSLSLYYSQKSLTHNIGNASAFPIISPFKKLIITAVSGKPLTARNCLSFCWPPECNGGPAAGAWTCTPAEYYSIPE